MELDVGGVTDGFKVRRSMLCSVKGSALESMFSGRHALPILNNGKIFVDRDPKCFLLMINFLRNNMTYPQNLDDEARELLEMELDFWCMGPSRSEYSDCKSERSSKPDTITQRITDIFNSRPNANQLVVHNWQHSGPFDLSPFI